MSCRCCEFFFSPELPPKHTETYCEKVSRMLPQHRETADGNIDISVYIHKQGKDKIRKEWLFQQTNTTNKSAHVDKFQQQIDNKPKYHVLIVYVFFCVCVHYNQELYSYYSSTLPIT